MTRAALVALLVAACGAPTAPTGSGTVRLVATGSSDTVRFEVPVVAQRCVEGRGLLVHGARHGQGVLVLLRAAGGATLDTGAYRLLTRGDTTAARGAIAAVRFLVGEVAHGLTLDDGTATVRRATAPFTVRVRGIGLEMSLGQRRTAEFALERVPLAPDSVLCPPQP